jgi:hypothetical protein
MNAVTYGNLNLFKTNGNIVHIMPSEIKLLQEPSITSMPIPAYVQTKSPKGIWKVEPIQLFPSKIQECSIKEVALFYGIEEKYVGIKDIMNY